MNTHPDATESHRLCAVFFADIAGYTSLSSADETAAQRWRDQLEAISRREVEGHGGRIVKYIGDEVLAEFQSTREAVDAALALSVAFSAGTSAGKLRVGIHIGEVLARGGDVHGPTVNLAARIRGEAARGEVLVSEAVYQDLRSFRRFAFAGVRRVRGLQERIRVYSVEREDLETPRNHLQPAAVWSPSPEQLLARYLDECIRTTAGRAARYVPIGGIASDVPPTDPLSEAIDPALIPLLIVDDYGPKSSEKTLATLNEAWEIAGRLILVGEGGAGKTEYLRVLMHSAASHFREPDTHSDGRVPLLVPWEEWKPDQLDFESFVFNRMRHNIGADLDPNLLLLLLDGVDDPLAQLGDEAIREVAEWCDAHPRLRAAVAVRKDVGPYLPWSGIGLSSLTDAQVELFCVRYLGEDEAHALLSGVGWNAGPEARDDGVLRLLRNPFNLTMLCWAQGKKGHVPQTRAELVRAVVSLAHARESLKGHTPPLPMFCEAMGELALDTVVGGGVRIPSRAWRTLTARSEHEAILRLARGAGVVEPRPGGNGYEFSHPLIAAYFAGEYCQGLSGGGDVSSLLALPTYTGGTRAPQHTDDVVLMAYQLDPSIERLVGIAERDPLLAASCLDSMSTELQPQTASAYVGFFVAEMLDSREAATQAAAAYYLMRAGARGIHALRAAMDSEAHWVRRRAVRIAARIARPEAIAIVVDALDDGHKWVVGDATECLATLRADGVAALRALVRDGLGDRTVQLIEQLATICAQFHPDVQTELEAATGIVPMPSQVASATSALPPVPEEDLETRIEGWVSGWKTLLGDPNKAAEGRHWLSAFPKSAPGWSTLWAALWDGTPEDGYGIHREQLERLGNEWLGDQAGKMRDWASVWMRLFDAKPGDAELIRLGQQGFALETQVGWCSTKVWRALFPHCFANRAFVDTSVRWLRAVNSGQYVGRWQEIAQGLSSVRQLPPDLGSRLLDRTHPMEPAPEDDARRAKWLVHTYSSGDRWAVAWQQLWDTAHFAALLAPHGMRWLRERRSSPGSHWNWIWKRLHEVNFDNDTLMALGSEWIKMEAGASTPTAKGWVLIWAPVVQAFPEDEGLLAIGRRWMHDRAFVHQTWPVLFNALWDADAANRASYGAMARAWLCSRPPEKRGYASIWTTLWDTGESGQWIQDAGLAFLACPVQLEGWPEVAVRLWAIAPNRAALRPLLTSWLREHDDHPLGDELQEHLTQSSVAPQPERTN